LLSTAATQLLATTATQIGITNRLIWIVRDKFQRAKQVSNENITPYPKKFTNHNTATKAKAKIINQYFSYYEPAFIPYYKLC
jgi:hypothetical protein